MIRPICIQCNINVCPVNYWRNGKIYYRKICDSCGRKKEKQKPRVPNWEKSGYKKKSVCDLCGFKSLYPTQMTVFHVDGSLTNIQLNNLRTICLNCIEVVKRKNVNWKRGDLQIEY